MSQMQVLEDERIDPMVLIRDFLKSGDKADPQALKTLFELQREWVKDQAAAKYAGAIASFQAECPEVVKTREVVNKDGKSVRYKFAAFEDVMTTIAPVLAKHKIAVMISGPTQKDLFDLTVRVRVGIHEEHFPYSAPMPDLEKLAAGMYMTQPQAFGMAQSYHKRYALCAALGIKVVGEDTDARLNPPDIGDEQLKEIHDLIDECGKAEVPINWPKLYEVIGLDAEIGISGASEAQGKKLASMLREKLKKGRAAK